MMFQRPAPPTSSLVTSVHYYPRNTIRGEATREEKVASECLTLSTDAPNVTALMDKGCLSNTTLSSQTTPLDHAPAPASIPLSFYFLSNPLRPTPRPRPLHLHLHSHRCSRPTLRRRMYQLIPAHTMPADTSTNATITANTPLSTSPTLPTSSFRSKTSRLSIQGRKSAWFAKSQLGGFRAFIAAGEHVSETP